MHRLLFLVAFALALPSSLFPRSQGASGSVRIREKEGGGKRDGQDSKRKGGGVGQEGGGREDVCDQRQVPPAGAYAVLSDSHPARTQSSRVPNKTNLFTRCNTWKRYAGMRERGKESREARNATRAQRRGRGEAQKRRGRVRARAKLKAIPQQFARAPVKEK